MSKIDFALIQALSQVKTSFILGIKKRASHRGAFFIAGVFVALAAISATPALAVECPADRIDETAIVSQVIDGDTLRLKDGRLIRFIGINTPEMGRDGKSPEPLAEQASLMLKNILGISRVKNKTMVGLRFGTERKDRHGRTLAHVFLEDGRSVETELLSAGLAAQIVVPPNGWNRECYRTAENVARNENKGVWSNIYRPMPVHKLPRDSRGFRVISGRVIRVGESKRSIWLNFPRRQDEKPREGVAVRINRKDLDHFTEWDPGQLKGKQIIVRGWIHPYKKQLVMQLRHPYALEFMSEK